MSTRRIIFEEVSLKVVYQFKDPVNGKPRQKTKKFFQTINPFNTNADGTLKTREQIKAELVVERNKWLAECKAGAA